MNKYIFINISYRNNLEYNLHSSLFAVMFEPIDGALYGGVEGRELEVLVQSPQLLVGGGLLVLAIRLADIEHQLPLVAVRLLHSLGHLGNRHLVFFVHYLRKI